MLSGLLVGAALGAVMARGGVCFNAGVRRAVFDRRPRVLRIFAVAIGVQLLILPLVVEGGVPVRPIGLLPVAQVLGGLTFGVGMALAGGCITGILWKTGAGSVATGIALAGFVGGELLIRGPGSDIVDRLDRAGPRPSTATLHDAVGVPYGILAPMLGLALLGLVLRRGRSAWRFGVAVGLIGVAAWIMADQVDYGYGLGFVGGADTVRSAVAAGDAGLLSPVPFVALGMLVGAAVALRPPLRRPDAARAGRALVGGVLMGVGGNVAHGCNIGHGLTGLPLLSLGSLVALTAMAVGAALSWRLMLRDRPALRGVERPRDVDAAVPT